MTPHRSNSSEAAGAVAGRRLSARGQCMAFEIISQQRPLFVHRERRGFHRIFAAAFVMCLLAALVDLFLPRRWRLLPQRDEWRRPFFDRVIDEAKALTAFAFMD